MTISIQSPGATFAPSNALSSLTLPTRKGLVMELMLGTSLAASTVNRAAPSGLNAIKMTAAGSGGANGIYPLAISGGGGSGATGVFTVTSGAVSAVSLTSVGTGYTSAPTISFAACPGLTGAAASAQSAILEVAAVSALAITSAGSGGANGTFNLAFSGGGGTGAAGTFTVAGGVITAVNLTNGGKAYTSAPAVDASASAGLTGAVVTAVRTGPTYNANSAIVKNQLSNLGGYGFDTGLVPSADHTIICVRKNSSNGSQYQLNNLVGAVGYFGFGEYNSKFTYYGNTGSISNGQNGPTVTAGTYFMAGRVTAGGFAKLSMYTTGARVDYLEITAAVAPTYPMVIGGPAIGSSAGQTAELYFFAVYNRVLTDGEIDAAHAQLVAYFANLGITVV